MELLLFHVVLVVLLSEALGRVKGKSLTTEKCNASALTVPGSVVKSFRLGEEVNLTCGKETWTKDNIMYVIWNLNLTDKVCQIKCNTEGDYTDTCLDHKVLRNDTEGRPVLHIPHFSHRDVGNYSCDSAYSRGAHEFVYHVSITAPPDVSSWVERRGDRWVAVCSAERASPAANISWGISGTVAMETVREADGLITVTSSVELNTTEEAQNMSCTVTHVYWDQPLVTVPNSNRSQTTSQSHPAIFIAMTTAISVLFCLALLALGIKKVTLLRMNQKSSKSASEDYVEEVEPYESYVQRVNSIYNSSRDLFV